MDAVNAVDASEMVEHASERSAIADDDSLSQQERFEQFMGLVSRIADEYPKRCKITVHAPGYTIADRARELQAEKQAQEKAEMERIRQVRARRNKAKIGASGKYAGGSGLHG